MILIAFLVNGMTFVNLVSTHTMKASDYTTYPVKQTMIILSEELMKDAKLKELQVNKIRKEHSMFLAYEVGVTMGKIREKYKRMMEIYHDSDVKLNKKFNLSPPGLRDLRPFHFILNMELIHTLEVDIDKLVHVLEVIPDDWHASMFPQSGGQQPPHQYPGGGSPHLYPGGGPPHQYPGGGPPQQYPGAPPHQYPGAPLGPRAGAVQDDYESISEELEARKRHQEELVKSRYREEHLMRKLGLPSNGTTTKKRFQDRWPVEDTWALDEYTMT